jgi:1-acyl-sn-glycerol-3-phosphate acyltransferase
MSERVNDVWDERVAGVIAALRQRLTGDYEVDEFGFDKHLTDSVFLPLLRPLYRNWFRTDVSGAENVPLEGGALIVANHSGTIPLDAVMLAVGVHEAAERYLRLLGADLLFRMPVLSELARKGGGTLACGPDAERLMRAGELVGVFPEGFKGVGKPFAERYKLQRFGRGGFVSAALRTGVPIIPVSIVGAEEAYPMLGNVKSIARLFGLPYFPITPTFPWLGPLGLVPLPSKWLIEFGKPIETSHLADDVDDPLVVFNLADQVREAIQQSLYELLQRRPEPFS